MAMSRKRKAPVEHNNMLGKPIEGTTMQPLENAKHTDHCAKKRKARHDCPLIWSQTAKDEPTIGGSTRMAKQEDGSRVSKSRPTGKRQREDHSPSTPQNKRFKDALPPTPADTPTRGASNLFDRLNLVSSQPQNTLSKDRVQYGTPPLTPSRSSKSAQLQTPVSLPEASQHIIRLFSAFVNATSIYLAHHKSTSSAPLSELLPLVTKSWKTRAVSLHDLRRLLQVLGDDAPFELVDDGEGRIKLEEKDCVTTSIGINPRELNAHFEENLKQQWSEWPDKTGNDTDDWLSFSRSLPLITIARGEFAIEPSTLPRGQDRLNRFKREVVETRAEEASSKKPAVPAELKTNAAVSSRGSSLLDRIMAKQQLASSRSSGPTQEEVDRKAALDRIEEIAMVLDVLSGGRPRISFSMQMLVQNLQNSLRNPISKEEAERSLGLMASEIVPSFVSEIRSGTLHGIVITKGGRLSNVELRRRLDRA